MSEREIAAYHEAGHAVVALMLGVRVPQIELTLFKDAKVSGNTTIDAAPPGKSDSRPEQMLNKLISCAAGPVAEKRYLKLPGPFYEVFGDIDSARNLVSSIYPGIDSNPLFGAAIATAEGLLGQATAWKAVSALAAELTARKRLGEKEILDIVRPTGLLNRV